MTPPDGTRRNWPVTEREPLLACPPWLEVVREKLALPGGGTADFFLGGYYKFVPYPDFGDQPAVGFTTGIQRSRVEDSELSRDVENDLALRFIPFAAKKYELDGANAEPFVALPLALRNFGDETEFASQFVI